MQVDVFKKISCKDLTVNFIGEDGIEYTYKVPKCYFECEKNPTIIRSHNGYITLAEFLNSATMHIEVDREENQDILFTVDFKEVEKEN